MKQIFLIFISFNMLWIWGQPELTLERKAAIYSWLELYQQQDPFLKKAALRALVACGPEIIPIVATQANKSTELASLVALLKNPQPLLFQDLEAQAEPRLKKFLLRYQNQKNSAPLSIHHRKISSLPPLATPAFIDCSQMKEYGELQQLMDKKLTRLFKEKELYPLGSKESAELLLIAKVFRPKIYTENLAGEIYWKGEMQLHLLFYASAKKSLLKEYTTSPKVFEKKSLNTAKKILEKLIKLALIDFEKQLRVQKWTVEVPLFKGENFKYERGVYLLIADQTEQALSFFSQIKQEERDSDFYYNLGITYEVLGKIKEAFKSFQQAIALQPDSQEYQKATKRCQSLMYRNK